MKRSPTPLNKREPAPRKPSSSKPPVAIDLPTSNPVGWNCIISMSMNSAPARYAIACPSAAFSSDGEEIWYIVAPAPVAASVAFARAAMNRPRRLSSSSAPVMRDESPSKSRPRVSSSTVMFGCSSTQSRRFAMISMPVRSPLCTVRSKLCPANGFWWIVPSGLRSKRQPILFSSSMIRSGESETSAHASSWLLRNCPPLIVSSKCRSNESFGLSTQLYPPCTMRVHPLWPSRPLTTITIRRRGLMSVACSAASIPAPPAPRIKRSQDISSSGSNRFLRRHVQVRIPDKRRHAPIRPHESEDDQHAGDRPANPRPDPAVIQDDVPQAVEPVIQRDQQERDLDRLHPRVAHPLLHHLEREIAMADVGGVVVRPEVQHKQPEQRDARHPLQIPVKYATVSHHAQPFTLVVILSAAKDLHRSDAGDPSLRSG